MRCGLSVTRDFPIKLDVGRLLVEVARFKVVPLVFTICLILSDDCEDCHRLDLSREMREI